MPEVISDASSAALPVALDANMAAFWAPYGRAPGSRFASDETATWFYTGVPHPLFNGVMGARLEPADVAPLVSRLARLIAGNGAPMLWWLGPLSTPDDLGGRLEGLGLQAAGEAPAMAIDLGRLPDALPIADLVVERVAGAEARMQWARTAAVGSEFSQAAADKLVAIEASLTDQAYRGQSRYIGFLDGVPVAASALVLEAGAAGIYAVATIPTARNRGIGRLMTLKPLLDARAMGYRVGVLQASAMGLPIYAKLGFAEVGMYRLYLQTG